MHIYIKLGPIRHLVTGEKVKRWEGTTKKRIHEIYDPVATNDANEQIELMKSYLQSGFGKRDMLPCRFLIKRAIEH